MFSGQFGIHNGAVNHGGLAADRFLVGCERGFSTDGQFPGFIASLRKQDIYPVSFSPYAERHSAWWFCEGWREIYNTGKRGSEDASEIVPGALRWIDEHGKNDDWMLHVNIWDPHGPYRAPEDFGNPFADEPIEDWYTEQLRQQQWESFGPGGPQEPGGGYGRAWYQDYPRYPGPVTSMAEYRRWIDGYDCGIAYADMWLGRIFDALANQGVLDETLIIITSDHGENMGELAVIGDHATADMGTSRVPMIVRHPDLPGGRADAGLYNQVDIAATVIELMGGTVPGHWDGRSFAEQFRAGKPGGRDYAVFSQCAWSCQRSVRWDDWLYIRTYHTGLKNYPARMLFNVAADPHELNNLAESAPAMAGKGQSLLDGWHAEMMATSRTGVDPLDTVLAEGGPIHANNRQIESYAQRLRETRRAHHAEFLEAHPTGLVEK